MIHKNIFSVQSWCATASCTSYPNVDFNNNGGCNDQTQSCICVAGYSGQFCQSKWHFHQLVDLRMGRVVDARYSLLWRTKDFLEIWTPTPKFLLFCNFLCQELTENERTWIREKGRMEHVPGAHLGSANDSFSFSDSFIVGLFIDLECPHDFGTRPWHFYDKMII